MGEIHLELRCAKEKGARIYTPLDSLLKFLDDSDEPYARQKVEDMVRNFLNTLDGVGTEEGFSSEKIFDDDE